MGQPRPPVPAVVIMGVSGCGKSSVGSALASLLGVPFVDGDSFHSAENVVKMSAGIPLDDHDRWPWIDAIGVWAAQQRSTGAVIACSALRRRYRDRLRDAAGEVVFVHLHAPLEVISVRVAARGDHFMPARLVESQFDALEPLDADEQGVIVSVQQPFPKVVEDALAALLRASPGKRPPEDSRQARKINGNRSTEDGHQDSTGR
jgi:gluconokinase